MSDFTLGQHESRLDSIDKRLETIEPKIDTITEYIAEIRAGNATRKERRDYWGLVSSGGIAAVIGSVFTYFMSR